MALQDALYRAAMERQEASRALRVALTKLEHEPLDLNERVTGTIELLRRTLGDQVTVTLKCSPEPCQISANPGDVDNVVLNLAINARDAMPDGGVLTIGTSHVTLDADAAGRIPNGRPGDYAMLTVSDTGRGMSPQVLEQAMEPFFSTKEPGKSAGLGLATVRGTVRQSGGFIAIESAVGKGTVHDPAALTLQATPVTTMPP